MNLQHYYWVFQDAVPINVCDDILKYAQENKQAEREAITGDFGQNRNVVKKPLNKKEKDKLHRIRKSKVLWFDHRWIYKEIQPYVHEANRKADWNYQWDWSESCQFTKYSKGQFYDWHCDSWQGVYKDEGPQQGKVRKLSVTLCLNEPNEYEGGNLEFDFRNTHPDKGRKFISSGRLSKGSLVVFPSFVWHRVTKVTKGTRYSLVIWNCGWPFK